MFEIVFLILFLISYWGIIFIFSFLLSKEDILFSCIDEDENKLIENKWGNYCNTLRHWRIQIKFVKIFIKVWDESKRERRRQRV